MLIAAAGLALAAGVARAQVEVTESGAAKVDMPAMAASVSPAVLERLEAPFLSPDEGRALRIFHGVWRDDDLDTPERRARARLVRGVFELEDDAPVLLRAEAALRRGDLDEAVALSEGVNGLTAARIRAMALHGLGRIDEAAALTEGVDTALERATDPEALVDAVRLVALRAQLIDPGEQAAGVYRAILGALGRARNTLDRLDWRVRLAEAEILLDKGNRQEAQAALTEVLALNPRSAEAMRMLGEMAVGSFAFEPALEIADDLDALAGEDGPSVGAAMIRAQAALRQGDADGAELALAPAMERYPRHRGLMGLHAAAAARGHNDEALENRLAALDAISPNAAAGWMKVGRALSEARQYDHAREVLTEATRREPAWARPWTELGLMEVQAGRDEAARAALERAFALDPFNIRVDNSLRLVRGLIEEFQTIEGEHFAVRYRPGLDAVLAPEVLAAMEGVHERVCGDAPGSIRHTPRQRTLIELMPDHAWFSVRITGTPQLWTMAAATGPVIAMETPRDGVGQSVGAYDWERVLRHEYVHTVTLDRTNNRIPHWFTEAAAVYLEDAPRDYARCKLLAAALAGDALFALDEINVMFVRPEKPTDRSQAYAQGAWMYEFIIERFGDDAPLRLMDRYAEGWTETRAFEEELGLTTEGFKAEFVPWAREQVIAWGLALPEGVPSAAELLAAAQEPERLIKRAPDAAAGEGPFAMPEPNDTPTTLADVSDEMLAVWLAEHPEHPELLELALRREVALWGGDLVGDALALAERYAEARPVDDLPHRLLAQFYLSGEGEFLEQPIGPEGAIPHLEYLDAREVNSPAYAAELAQRYGELGRFDEGLAKAQRALRLAPFDADYRELAARLAILAEAWGEAERQLLALMMIEPEIEHHRARLEALHAMFAEGEAG